MRRNHFISRTLIFPKTMRKPVKSAAGNRCARICGLAMCLLVAATAFANHYREKSGTREHVGLKAKPVDPVVKGMRASTAKRAPHPERARRVRPHVSVSAPAGLASGPEFRPIRKPSNGRLFPRFRAGSRPIRLPIVALTKEEHPSRAMQTPRPDPQSQEGRPRPGRHAATRGLKSTTRIDRTWSKPARSHPTREPE
jgi:hypothetical protein